MVSCRVGGLCPHRRKDSSRPALFSPFPDTYIRTDSGSWRATASLSAGFSPDAFVSSGQESELPATTGTRGRPQIGPGDLLQGLEESDRRVLSAFHRSATTFQCVCRFDVLSGMEQTRVIPWRFEFRLCRSKAAPFAR